MLYGSVPVCVLIDNSRQYLGQMVPAKTRTDVTTIRGIEAKNVRKEESKKNVNGKNYTCVKQSVREKKFQEKSSQKEII